MATNSFFGSTIFKILVFIFGTMILGALIAPPLYVGGKHVVEQGWLEGSFLDGLNGSLDRAKFPRYFNRAILISALLLLWPILKWINVGKSKQSEGKRPLGESLLLQPNPSWWKHILIGFLVAGGSLLLLGWFYVNQGWYEARETEKAIPGVLFGALGTGFAVGFLEEFVFRGALYALLNRLLKPRMLYFAIAFFFAIIHFFHAPRKMDIDPVTWLSGFTMIGQIFAYFFSQFGNPSFLAAEFAVLFSIGLVLGYCREKTNSLWLPIGLHAGWVFGVKTLSPLTQRNFEPDEMMPWLGDTLRVGVISCLVVCVTWLGLWIWLRGRSASKID